MSTSFPRACIVDCAGPVLSEEERALFAEYDPLGFILFARHCESPAQVRRLVQDLRAAVNREDAPVLIDQEGGRVARLQPPHWRATLPAAVFGQLYARDAKAGKEAAYLHARLMAEELYGLGITVDCAPMLDVRAPASHDIIGDRAYGENAEVVTALGDAVRRGLQDGGILPVIKHLPGHGRAVADSHEALPVVDASRAELESTDFAPFHALAAVSDPLWGMTAHIRYTAIDPTLPATFSPVTLRLIRDVIGFKGVLLSDDLKMRALEDWPVAERVCRCLDAGCDIALWCNGTLPELREVLAASPPLPEETARLITRQTACLSPRGADPEGVFNTAQAETQLAALLERTPALHA